MMGKLPIRKVVCQEGEDARMIERGNTVVIVATGGTIATRIDPILKAPVPALSGEEIVAAVPQLKELATIRVVEYSNVPSPWMGPDRWPILASKIQSLLDEPETRGVVVTHGTDTIDQTAFFLDLTLNGDKPVVVIGAQRNSSEVDADGPRNLVNAVRQIMAPGSGGKGVTVTMNHRINAARYVRKTHTNNVHTFTSGDVGYIGYVDFDRVDFFFQPLQHLRLSLPTLLPRVDLISMYAGANGEYVRYAAEQGAQGIVIDAFGLGHVNEAMHDAIEYAIGKGVPVVVASKVPHGRTQPVYGYRGSGKLLQNSGVVFSGDLSADKSRILMMLVLASSKAPEALAAAFAASWQGAAVPEV